MFSVIAIIGAGNMGSSLVGGLLKHGHPKDKIRVADPCEEKLAQLKNKDGVQTFTSNQEAVATADVVIFAVKPQGFEQVARELAPMIQQKKPLVISIAAGINQASMENWLGKQIPIIRTMPNTPALIQSGATAANANAFVSEADRAIAAYILTSVGLLIWVDDEKLLDIVTALSGSGPAYFYRMMEVLEETATELGLPAETAHVLTVYTALGAAQMAIKTNTPLAELRARVTSKGGTTERALAVLEELDIRMMFRKAIQAAKKRSEELSHQSGD